MPEDIKSSTRCRSGSIWNQLVPIPGIPEDTDETTERAGAPHVRKSPRLSLSK